MTTYSRVEHLELKNCKVTVYHPDLTEEERAKRFEELKKATARFMAAVEKERMKQNGKEQFSGRTGS